MEAMPPPVWQNIAAHFELTEWARICGASRAMHALPLRSLNISAAVPHEGLEWASKRWAKAARLRIEYSEAARQRVAEVMMRGVRELDGLQELILDCPKASGTQQREAACMWIGALLALCAHTLRVLSITLDDVPALPPLRALQHLKLTVYDGASALAASSIAELPRLVTCAMAFRGDVGDDAAPLRIPPLHLAALSQLRYVGLSGLQPAALSLPPACRLEVKDVGCGPVGVWASVGANIGCISLSHGALRPQSLPRLVQLPCAGLQLLHLHLCGLGQGSQPIVLPAHALRVKWLCISTKKGLHIDLAGRVACEELSFISHGTLGVGFDDAALDSIASAQPKFRFSWRKYFGMGLFRLTARLAADGVALDIRHMQGYSYVSGFPAGRSAECACGECYSCAMSVLPKYDWARSLPRAPSWS